MNNFPFMDIEKLANEKMMKADDEQVKNFAHVLWVMYSSFIREGFTNQQAMSLIAETVRPRIGG